ncbi:hypothetical protein GCM10009429_08940 [Dyella marensis]
MGPVHQASSRDWRIRAPASCAIAAEASRHASPPRNPRFALPFMMCPTLKSVSALLPGYAPPGNTTNGSGEGE